jgi:hypothetical protein
MSADWWNTTRTAKLNALRWDYNQNRPHRALHGLSPRQFGERMLTTVAESLSQRTENPHRQALAAQQLASLDKTSIGTVTRSKRIAPEHPVFRDNAIYQFARSYALANIRKLNVLSSWPHH